MLQIRPSAITNNLYGQRASGGKEPFSGDSVNSIGTAVKAYMASSSVKNNGLPGATVGTACSGLSNSVPYPLAATLQVGTTAGTTGVHLQYGATPMLGGTADFPLNGRGTAQVALPLMNGSPTYYRLQFLNGAAVTYASPLAVQLGGA